MRSEENFQELSSLWVSSTSRRRLLRAWDAQLEDTLSLAAAGGLVEVADTGRRILTPKGADFVEALRQLDDAPLQEVQRNLASLGQV